MNNIKYAVVSLVIAAIGVAAGFMIGKNVTLKKMEASLYKMPMISTGDYKWKCEGMAGCWCEGSNGTMAPRDRQVSQTACEKALNKASTSYSR